MINFSDNEGWYLDDNGVNVMAKNSLHVVDLRADCKVIRVYRNKAQVVVELSRVSEYTKSNLVKLNAAFRLNIDNVLDFEAPGCEFPTVFEGIYDYTGKSLSLCLGDSTCYKVQGENLKISLEMNDMTA